MIFEIGVGVLGLSLAILAMKSIYLLPPTERGLVERFGKYNRFAEPGLHILIPIAESMRVINVTEQMVDAESQEVITRDNLNANVDAQIYFRVKNDETSVKNSQYNVNDYEVQIVAIARTTLRDIVGTMKFTDVNSRRAELNTKLQKELDVETKNWGISVVRTELKEIEPPEDVQETMNKVLKAEKEKEAAIDFATATETQADGERRASIKRAEGIKRSRILEAEGEASYIKTVNEAAKKYFVGNAKDLKKLEVTEACLKNNSKIVLQSKGELINIIGESAGILPIKKE